MKLKIKDDTTVSQLNELGINNNDYFASVRYDNNNILYFECSDDYYTNELEDVAKKIYKLTKAGLLEEV